MCNKGVALEAISLAGHLKLNNLTIMYDNNQVTCDGSVDMTNTEDINAKMRACNWDVVDIEDGCFDVDGIVAALKQARSSREKPTFVNIRTVIGVGSSVAGDAVAHGVALPEDGVRAMKETWGFNPDESLKLPDEMKDFFKDLPERGEKWVTEWQELVADYKKQHPELGKAFEARMTGDLPAGWEDLIPKEYPDAPTPSRKSSGLTINPLAEKFNTFMVGTADLSPSVNLLYSGKNAFQHVSNATPPILSSGPPY